MSVAALKCSIISSHPENAVVKGVKKLTNSLLVIQVQSPLWEKNEACSAYWTRRSDGCIDDTVFPGYGDAGAVDSRST